MHLESYRRSSRFAVWPLLVAKGYGLVFSSVAQKKPKRLTRADVAHFHKCVRVPGALPPVLVRRRVTPLVRRLGDGVVPCPVLVASGLVVRGVRFAWSLPSHCEQHAAQPTSSPKRDCSIISPVHGRLQSSWLITFFAFLINSESIFD